MIRRRFVTLTIVVASLFLVSAPVGVVWLVSRQAQEQTDAIARAAARSELRACIARNHLRDGIIDYITTLDSTRRRGALAVIVSPMASPQEKQASILALHAMGYADRQAHVKFAHESCAGEVNP